MRLPASIAIHDRSLTITTSKAARHALSQRHAPLRVEMELYFSCLIRKQVRFHETLADEAVRVNDQLQVSFRPVMTRACGKDYDGDEPPLTDFPIVNARAYVPRWLHIDYVHGQWQGEFGYEKQP
ncbi:MAG TPA: hypothetical protein ENI97_15250 [Gammaproteobacteria bacterium]|nr:hypothetical protein [Gammaproteobacteria bacterium]